MWREEQEKLVERLSNLEGGVVLSGDGRSDSPGHSAKYGAFTVIEQRTNKILDVQLVQVSYPSSDPSLSPQKSIYICTMMT